MSNGNTSNLLEKIRKLEAASKIRPILFEQAWGLLKECEAELSRQNSATKDLQTEIAALHVNEIKLNAAIEAHKASKVPPDATDAEWSDAVRQVWKLAREKNNTIPSHWLDAMRDLLLASAPPAPQAEQFCYCNPDISLQIVSGGAATEGLYGRVTLKVGEDYVDYVRASVMKQEPFGQVTVRRLSQRFENHVDDYRFFPWPQPPYLDNADECHTVYTHPAPVREPMTDSLVAEAFCEQCPEDAVERVRVFGKGVRFAERHHGITKDTP